MPHTHVHVHTQGRVTVDIIVSTRSDCVHPRMHDNNISITAHFREVVVGKPLFAVVVV